MHKTFNLSPENVLEKLRVGNRAYLTASRSSGNISPEVRLKTFEKGQKPYAIVLTCSDSRVIPECIFSAGIGELFVIRVAGNVIDEHQLGSIEYAAEHLNCKLVLILGHTHCGAVSAAIAGEVSGYIKYITDDIQQAIGDEADDYKACCLNVRHSMKKLLECPAIQELESNRELHIAGGVYHMDTGLVEFLHMNISN